VQADAAQRLNCLLQLRQREGRRHQFEHHRAVLDLTAKPSDRGRQDAAVIDRHRDTDAAAFLHRQSAIARRLRHQPCLVE